MKGWGVSIELLISPLRVTSIARIYWHEVRQLIIMREIVDVLISGATSGSVYAMMTVGMSLVYGVSKVFNFASDLTSDWSFLFL
jgi:hypothetical protein